MCKKDNNGKITEDCGLCICDTSKFYNKHKYDRPGASYKIGDVTVKTWKCSRGCGKYKTPSA